MFVSYRKYLFSLMMCKNSIHISHVHVPHNSIVGNPRLMTLKYSPLMNEQYLNVIGRGLLMMPVYIRDGSRGVGRAPLKLENMIFWRKIVIILNATPNLKSSIRPCRCHGELLSNFHMCNVKFYIIFFQIWVL